MGIPFGVSLFWGGGRYCVPFGWSGLLRCLGAQRPVGRLPGGGPRFSRETGGKRARGESFSPLDSLLWFKGPCKGSSFFLPGLRPICPTPVTARPPAGRAGKGRNFGTRCAGLPKLGDAPRPAPAKLALSGREVCFGRRSRSKHDWIFFPRLRAGKLCEACPAGRVYWAEGLDALQGSSHVQSLPLGGKVGRRSRVG